MRRHRPMLLFWLASPLLFAAAALVLRGGPEPAKGSASSSALTTITVDRAQRFQTIVGWEATSQSGQDQPDFKLFSDRLFDLAVDELGINRLRVGLSKRMENRFDPFTEPSEAKPDSPCAPYRAVNDNDDPNSIDWNGFHFESLDNTVRKIVLPLRQRLEARGEKLYLSLQYVAFVARCEVAEEAKVYVHSRPEEYAEYVLAAFLHLREKFNLVPDALNVILEPDNVPGWSGERIGLAMVATAQRLAAAGFHPEFIAPSTTRIASSSGYVAAIVAVPGARQLLSEISFHRYQRAPPQALVAFAARAAKLGIRTSMLEHIGGDVEELYNDLSLAQVSAWQQYTLAFPAKTDNGAQHYQIVGRELVLGSRSRYLRHYFRYVRAGAVRIGAASDDAALRTLAFLDRAGRAVVVVHLPTPRELSFKGLPPGAYGASLTSETELGRELGELVAGADGTLRFRAPSAGVLTLYPR